MVADGKFREDLYYRLCGVVLEVPPLRERGQDLVQLANHFLIEIGRERNEPVRTLSVEAIEVITQHTWPGNVRELQNVLRAATLFADGLVIEANVVIDQMHTPGTEELEPVSSSGPRSGPRSRAPSDPSTLAFESIRQGETSLMELKRHIERECIVRALSETGGNITRAATLLGMKRPRLSQIIKELGLQKGEG